MGPLEEDGYRAAPGAAGVQARAAEAREAKARKEKQCEQAARAAAAEAPPRKTRREILMERDANTMGSPLHDAIVAGDLDEATRLIETGAHPLNRRNRKGLTPLMLAAVLQPSLGPLLLRHGAGSTVLMMSTLKKTAEEYARAAGHGQLAATLKELTEAALKADAENRCQVCQEPAKKHPNLAFMEDRVQRGQETNPLVKQFFGTEAGRSLKDTRYHRINDMRGLTKEITESVAAINAADARLAELGVGPEDPVHAIDLCCGKGITTAYLAALRPKWTVTAVDIISADLLPHYEDAGNAGYYPCNLLGETFREDIMRRVEEVGVATVAVLGIHLCGRLSIKAIELFQSFPRVKVIVLSPCCLPNKRDPIFPPSIYADKDQDRQYRRWVSYLHAVLEAGEAPSEVAAAQGEYFNCSKGMRELRRKFESMALPGERSAVAAEEAAAGGPGGTPPSAAAAAAGSGGGGEGGGGTGEEEGAGGGAGGVGPPPRKPGSASRLVEEFNDDIKSVKRAVLSAIK